MGDEVPEAGAVEPDASLSDSPGTVDDPAGAGLDVSSDVPLREELIRRFAVWVDRVLAGETEPGGIGQVLLDQLNAEGADGPQVAGPDLYTLHSAMTALTQEVKLQGRTFQRVASELDPLPAGQLAAIEENRRLARLVEEGLKALRESSEGIVTKEKKRLLEAIVNVRERLLRGADAVEEYREVTAESDPPGFFRRLLRGPRTKKASARSETVAALTHGYSLALAEIDETLEREGISVVDVDAGFDSMFMTVVDIEEDSGVTVGTVLEVYRNGYAWGGEPFRLAEVKVAASPRKPVSGIPEERTI